MNTVDVCNESARLLFLILLEHCGVVDVELEPEVGVEWRGRTMFARLLPGRGRHFRQLLLRIEEERLGVCAEKDSMRS